MPLINSTEVVIRVLLFFSALFSYIGFGWSGDSRSGLGNMFYILLIFILLFFVFKSGKKTMIQLYLALGATGAIVSVYFIYESIVVTKANPLLFFVNLIGLSILMLFSIFFREKEKKL